LELVGLAARFEPVATASAKFDLSVSLGEERAADGSPAGISGVIEYASDLFDRADVGGLAGRFLGGSGRGGGVSPAGISGVIEYASALFDRADVEGLAERLVRLLAAAVAAPERAI